MIGRLLARMRAHGTANAALLIASTIVCVMAGFIPIYASASSVMILDDLIGKAADEPTPPFSYFFATDADLEPTRWATLSNADHYLRGQAAQDLGLPSTEIDTRLVSRRFSVSEGGDDAPAQVAFTSIDRLEGDQFESLIEVAGGVVPSSDGATLEVMVSASSPFDLGTELVLVDELLSASDSGRLVSATVVGVWRPLTTADQRWIVSPSVLADQLIVARQTLTDRLQAGRPPVIATAQWSIIADAGVVEPGSLSLLADQTRSVAVEVGQRSSSISLARDPSRLLADVAGQRAELSNTLLAYAVPAGLLTLVFVAMVISFNIQQRRTELAVLRSRGLPVRYSVGSVVAEVVAVAAVAAVVGGIGALGLVQLMTRSTAFLAFDSVAIAPSFWQPLPFGWLAVTAIGIVAAHAVMLIRPAQETIVSRQRSRGRLVLAGRSIVASFDLIVVAFIGALMLQRRSLPVAENGLRDPWVIALPAAAGLGAGLLVVRILPVLAAQAARRLERTRAVPWFFGAQRMARAPRSYRWPVVLIVVATALTAFVASLSDTLERRLIDETYLVQGADHAVVEITPGRAANTPLSTFSQAPGVAEVTRTVELEGRFGETKAVNQTIEVIAVDPTTFAAATHWQASYDDQTLAELLAPLREVPGAVIVSTTMAQTHDLTLGDPIRYAVAARFDASGGVVWLDTGGVVGAITDRFPRWTGDDKAPLLVPNINSLSAQVDRFERSTTLVRMTERSLPLPADVRGISTSASERIDDARREPNRQAVFAILTTTFGVATTVALLSLFLQTMATFGERTLDVGVLRAMGIGRSSIRSMLSFDFLVVAIVGVVVGTGVGVGVARWLIPEIVGAANRTGELDAASQLAWPTISFTAAAFVAVALGVVAAVSPALARRNVFDALKLGESR